MRGLPRLENFRLCLFEDIKVARLERLQSFSFYHFQDIKVARVAMVAKFQDLSFS